jgi:hypothetical protein
MSILLSLFGFRSQQKDSSPQLAPELPSHEGSRDMSLTIRSTSTRCRVRILLIYNVSLFRPSAKGPSKNKRVRSQRLIRMLYLHRLSSLARHLRKPWAVLFLGAALLIVPTLWAHHGLAAFDTTHTVKMQGTVTDFQWINPHAYIYADLKDDKGKLANWKLEMGSLGMLTRLGGWSRDTVKPGDQVTVQGFRAKDGSAYMALGKIVLPNGQTLLGAP